MIDLVDYTQSVNFETIRMLTHENKIDTVYVRFATKDEDDCFHCENLIDMMKLKWIIKNTGPNVVGWRLHHHKRVL